MGHSNLKKEVNCPFLANLFRDHQMLGGQNINIEFWQDWLMPISSLLFLQFREFFWAAQKMNSLNQIIGIQVLVLQSNMSIGWAEVKW